MVLVNDYGVMGVRRWRLYVHKGGKCKPFAQKYYSGPARSTALFGQKCTLFTTNTGFSLHLRTIKSGWRYQGGEATSFA